MVPAGEGSVQLEDGQSASTLLHDVLARTVEAFPETFGSLSIPERDAFRKAYCDWLPQFESARLSSQARVQVARFAVGQAAAKLTWQSGNRAVPFAERLAQSAAGFDLHVREPGDEPGWEPVFDYRGQRWTGAQLAAFGEELSARGVITEAARASFDWAACNLLKNGQVTLSGRKVAVLGAGAEMASTEQFLAAGADVLWLDVAPPPQDWIDDRQGRGRLYWPAERADLLERPAEILATLAAFSNGSPVDVCLYAYAPGQAREFRLTATMNAIVNSMPAEMLASVTLLVSPTTPTTLDVWDVDAMKVRKSRRPWWESALDGAGLLGAGGGAAETPGAAATRTVVGIQGVSYQAAQYLGKVLMAECWAYHGFPDEDISTPLRVSANTAAITRTRSLEHPVFTAAFGGAHAFGVETFTPALSRNVNGLLAVCDWLRPEKPIPGRIRVHGGIHTLPYPLESTLRIAAAIGFVRSPGLVAGLLR